MDIKEAAPINIISFRHWKEYHQELLKDNSPEFLSNNEIDFSDESLSEKDEISALKTVKNGWAQVEIDSL